MRTYEIIYSDENVVVVNKAPDLACHPLASSEKPSLIVALAQEVPEVQTAFDGDREGGLCHRIDNGTSGIVVVARSPEVRAYYRELFSGAKLEKSYLAIVQGQMSGVFEVKNPIAHHVKNPRKMVAITSSKVRFRSQPQEAHTQGRVLLSTQEASLVRLRIGAGRRHQIRVHLASLGHPIIGDALYGGPEASFLRGHALHAATIQLPNGQALEAHCPAEWDDELKRLGLIAPDVKSQ